MYRAYFVTSTYSRIPDRKKEIAKGHTLVQCQAAIQSTNWWHYIIYLLTKRKCAKFEEYIYIAQPNGDMVWNTQKTSSIHQLLNKEQDDFTHISDVIDKVVEDTINGN